MKKSPLKIPVLKCPQCRHRRKPRLKYKAPFVYGVYGPLLLTSFRLGHPPPKQKPSWVLQDGGFECFCPVCGHKYDTILEKEIAKEPKE